MPQSACLSAGGGSNGYLGNAQMNRDFFYSGASLTWVVKYIYIYDQHRNPNMNNKDRLVVQLTSESLALCCFSFWFTLLWASLSSIDVRHKIEKGLISYQCSIDIKKRVVEGRWWIFRWWMSDNLWAQHALGKMQLKATDFLFKFKKKKTF